MVVDFFLVPKKMGEHARDHSGHARIGKVLANLFRCLDKMVTNRIGGNVQGFGDLLIAEALFTAELVNGLSLGRQLADGLAKQLTAFVVNDGLLRLVGSGRVRSGKGFEDAGLVSLFLEKGVGLIIDSAIDIRIRLLNGRQPFPRGPKRNKYLLCQLLGGKGIPCQMERRGIDTPLI